MFLLNSDFGSFWLMDCRPAGNPAYARSLPINPAVSCSRSSPSFHILQFSQFFLVVHSLATQPPLTFLYTSNKPHVSFIHHNTGNVSSKQDDEHTTIQTPCKSRRSFFSCECLGSLRMTRGCLDAIQYILINKTKSRLLGASTCLCHC